MKNKTYSTITAVFLMAVLLMIACKKDEMVKLSANVATWEIKNITDNSADISGFVVAGGSGFTEHGVCWNTSAAPTVNDSKGTIDKLEGAVYSVHLSGLNYTTKYYVRAYAVSADGGVLYGKDTSFTTAIRLPILSIADITNIEGKSATSGGNITDAGGGVIKTKGVCWGVLPSPTIDNHTTNEGTGAGAFVSNITGIVGATKYYVRAYATNEVGISYSNELSFTTPISSPVVTTKEVKDVKVFAATAVGYSENTGGAAISEIGFCWSTTIDPTTADNKVTSSTKVGQFEANLTGLSALTKYYVRAYSTNSAGTAYGENIEFTTLPDYPAKLFMTGNGVGQDAENWNWNEPLELVPVNSHPEMFWKIVWMKGSGEFKFAPQAAWSGGDFGKTGDATNGVYTKGGDNIPVPATAGYYMVVVDLDKNTIEIATPKVYGMGDVFGGWSGGDPNDLFTVDNASEVIKFTNVPNAGELRMYVAASTLNCDWWQAEFIILAGKIEFRGTGGDQARVNVTAGQNISLNFKAGTGTITP